MACFPRAASLLLLAAAASASTLAVAGGSTVCGVTGDNGSSVLLCWPPGPSTAGILRRVYRGAAPFSDLTVGDGHVAAYDAQARGIRWWRGAGGYQQLVPGAFRSLVSGDGFTCALQDTNSSSSSKVRRWGPSGSAVQAAFANTSSVSSLAAGGSRACGVDTATGAILCSGQSGAGALAQSDLYIG